MKIITRLIIKHYTLLFIGALILLSLSCNRKDSLITFESKTVKLQFDKTGELKAIIDKEKGENYLPKGEKSFLLSIRIKGVYENPIAMEIKDRKILLKYPSNIITTLKIEEKDTYLTFELIKTEGDSEVELVVWGPYPTTIKKTIGETVGVVRGDNFAIGLQALNIKTIGGYPWKENDCMPQIDIFEQNDFNDLSEKDKRYVLYRVEAAKPEDFGSTLQAYCRNRNKDRIIENLNHTKYVAPAYNDGGIIGSKIAIFGCPVDKALETIGSIEVNEGLPHPTIDGRWGKTSPGASAAYLIMGFGEEDIERALEITRKAGLRYLYHPGPFSTWGHFQLNKQFPHGREGLKQCVEKAKKEGIMLGVHTLSNFITTNDPYVTPVPDKRLAKVGNSVIVKDIDKVQTEIEIKSPKFFNQFKNNNLRTVVIGNELIRYGTITEKAPWKLTDCQRGAFGTTASSHNTGDTISKLADHGYKVFLTNVDLTKEVAGNIAGLFNETGVRQISFDGLEGNRSTGLGNYGETLMPYTWYNALTHNEKKQLIVDASRTTHFFWHIFTRMNWGEPWYAGFRESQTDYRMKNQKYFKRNMIPGMLGWFNMTAEISLEDMEWMLSRSAAYDAGYAFCTGYKTLEAHGQSDQILELIKQWEEARMSGAFPAELKKEMEDLSREYHLEPISDNKWKLSRVKTGIFRHKEQKKQPGEPLFSKFTFDNPYDSQPATITIQMINDTRCKNISVEMDNYKKVIFPVELSENRILRYSGNNTAVIYDKNWNKLRTISLNTNNMNIAKGEHTFTVDGDFSGGKSPEFKIEFKTMGDPVILTGKGK